MQAQAGRCFKYRNKNPAAVFHNAYTWLERIDGIKTFDDDPLGLEQDIVDIRQLLDEFDKQ